MLPATVKPLISRLDAGSFTALIGALAMAEGLRAGCTPSDIVVSDQINEGDGGLDVVVDAVPDSVTDLTPPSALRPGHKGLQLKTNKRKFPSAFNLSTELRKPGPKRVLADGGTYVLVSSQDLNPKQRSDLEQALGVTTGDVVPGLMV